MAEYIKREDAFRVIEQSPIAHLGTRFFCMDGIEAIPAADVVPRELYQRALSDVVTLSVERKRGKLLTNEFGYESCSVCHYGLMLFITDENNTLKKPSFCPNCGAEMEEEK
jgi:hypothetical protein